MKTVAIVGSHSKAKQTAPFDRPNVDIWVFNAVAGVHNSWVTRCDAVFQMHQPAVYRSPHNREDPQHWSWLQQPHGFPIYMLDEDPLVPACVRYPLGAICEALLLGWSQNDQSKQYFSSSIDYALALAVFQGYDRIEIHGVEMSSDTEYQYQRVGVAFWEGVALGRGVQVAHYGGEQIFDRPLYGYEGNLEYDIADLARRELELSSNRKEAQSLVYRAEMQIDDLWSEPLKLPEAIAAVRETKKRLGYYDASHEQAQRYLLKARAAQRAGKPCFIDRNEHEETAYGAQQACDEHDRKMKESAGKIDVSLQSWQNSGNPDALRWLKTFVAEHAAHAESLGKANGALNENLRFMHLADRAITAAGGTNAIEYVMQDVEAEAL